MGSRHTRLAAYPQLLCPYGVSRCCCARVVQCVSLILALIMPVLNLMLANCMFSHPHSVALCAALAVCSLHCVLLSLCAHCIDWCAAQPSEVCILSDKVERKRQYVLHQAAIGLEGEGLDMLTLKHCYGGALSHTLLLPLFCPSYAASVSNPRDVIRACCCCC